MVEALQRLLQTRRVELGLGVRVRGLLGEEGCGGTKGQRRSNLSLCLISRLRCSHVTSCCRLSLAWKSNFARPPQKKLVPCGGKAPLDTVSVSSTQRISDLIDGHLGHGLFDAQLSALLRPHLGITVEKRRGLRKAVGGGGRGGTSSGGAGLQAVPDDGVRAHDELWPGVPLVVGDIVVSLDPDPLLPLGEEPVVARLAFAVLHYYTHTEGERQRQAERESELYS